MTSKRVRIPADQKLPILDVTVGDLAPRVLVAGDPARVTKMAALLDDVRQIGDNREYRTYTGSWHGTPVSVVSHGVGAAGAAVAFEELCRAGATHLVRVGTAGGLDPTVTAGCVVVATGAVRADGMTARLVPPEYPAVADRHLVAALRGALDTRDVSVAEGIVLTEGDFYPSPVLPNDQPLWRDAGAVAVEMEVAPLLVIAGLNGVRAAAVLAIDGNPLAEDDEAMVGYDPRRDIVTRAVEHAITAALDALVTV